MLFFLLACMASTTTSIPSSTVEVTNKENHGCTVPYTLKKENKETFCWDEEKDRRHGPSIHTLANGTIQFHYEEGNITQVQIHSQEAMEQDVFLLEYLRNDAPLSLISDFIAYKPDYEHIQLLRIRLFTNTKIPFSDLIAIPISFDVCLETQSAQQCIRGKAFSQEITEDGISKQIIAQVPTTYFDEQIVSTLDVQDCMDTCLCTTIDIASEKLTWKQAEHYCSAKQKRLPTEAELILYSIQEDSLRSSTEWTSDWYTPLEKQLNIEPKSPCSKESSCASTQQKTILTNSLERKGSNLDEKHSFRCINSTKEAPAQKPLHLTEKPLLPPFSQVPTEKSWHKTDPVYRKMLANPSIDEPLAYRDIYMLTDKLWNIHKKFSSNTAVYRIGTTHMGYPILAFRISNTPTSDTLKPSILFFAGLHGNELMGSVQIIDQIERMLNSNDGHIQSLPHTFDLWFIPLLNPDGNIQMMRIDASSKMGRKNGRSTEGTCENSPSEGVDLQRNFPILWEESDPKSTHYSGMSNLSEPESQALQNLSQRYQFLAALSWHSPGNYVTSAYGKPDIKKPSPNIINAIADKMLSTENKWPPKLQEPKSDLDYGTPEDWMFHTFGTYAYQVRIAKHNLVLETYKESYIEKYRYIWQQFLDALYEHPSFEGVVLNGEKEPIVAQIRILGRIEPKTTFLYNQNEIWTSREHDGYYQQLVPDIGIYEVEINAPGYRKTRKKIHVDGPRTQSNIVLRKIP